MKTRFKMSPASEVEGRTDESFFTFYRVTLVNKKLFSQFPF